MQTAVNSVRFIVGVLFIISGLVKANDPLGLSYKMQEFFEVWNTSLSASSFFASAPLISFFNYLHDHSLALSVFMITLEVIAGIDLLLGWKKKIVLSLLLFLILFFTFLTAYAYLSGKFKNCGCFGDCLPITPFASFLKDIILLIMILFLWIKRQYISCLSSAKLSNSMMVATLAGILLFQWYVLNYLPIVDCLPFKKGNNIAEKMKIPANAVPDSFAMKFIYKRGGKQYEFSMDELPSDLDQYTFVDRKQTLVRKGNAEPPIKGFSLTGLSGADSTSFILQLPKAILVLFEDFSRPNQWKGDLAAIAERARRTRIPIYIVTPKPAEAIGVLQQNGIDTTGLQVFSADNTAVKTAARTNPTALLLVKGTIVDKKGSHQLDHLNVGHQ